MSKLKDTTYHTMSHSKGKQPPVKNRKTHYKSIESSIQAVKQNTFEVSDETDIVSMANYINSSIIGNNEFYVSPYGSRKIIYCDFVASGRSVDFIENFIR